MSKALVISMMQVYISEPLVMKLLIVTKANHGPGIQIEDHQAEDRDRIAEG